ncbi:hypothetical protein SLS60_009900 [Paraconiothyrium brasiliense]|uniref:Heterokaryon incompatibility domain-containing protein n=1 Tax=Paraconiothyrium brasiliense TaxID=300254 RepID=A0ABR3QTW0_9PLEO
MRLLRSDNNGWFYQAEFVGKNIPPYVILSHTWGEDWDEISFEDIRTGLGRKKAAYSKLKFCAERAAEDGLEYFWVDTCCIDKNSSTELSEAINSMFRWYRESVKCYAFLSDVPCAPGSRTKRSDRINSDIALELNDMSDPKLSEETTMPSIENHDEEDLKAFRQSKWFTRGWTLQELLAPEYVEFFAANGQILGDKSTLANEIFSITRIPTEALNGGFVSFSRFSEDERLSWAKGRETKREEDAAYSLLGLFDLAMPLIYGEGREKAFRRLHRERELAAAFEQTRSEKKIVRGNPSTSPGSDHLSQESDASEELTDEQHAELVQMWWDETVEVNMDSQDQYQKVAVLLLKWSDPLDELRVSMHGEIIVQLHKLATVFQKTFNFQTQIVELNVSSKPQHQLDRHIAAFIEAHDGPHSLLIVCYQGNSMFNSLHGRLELCASSDPARSFGISQSAVVNWRKAENMLCSDGVDGDVLMLLDVPYPAEFFESLRVSTQVKSTKRLCELISACPPSQSSPPPGPGSFTGALVETLQDLAHTSRSRFYSTGRINQRLRMAPNRKGTPSQMWSLFSDERHIALSPLDSKPTTQMPLLAPARSYLKLGLAFRDERLSREQIQFLSYQLGRALDNKRLLGLRKIDLLGVEIQPVAPLEWNVVARIAVTRWRQAIQIRQQSRGIAEGNVLSVVEAGASGVR